METIYFVLGILSMVSLIAIVGIVKIFSSVSQLRKNVDTLQQVMNNEFRAAHLEVKDTAKDIERFVTEVDRRVSEVDRELNRYIDSRYDKLLNLVKSK